MKYGRAREQLSAIILEQRGLPIRMGTLEFDWLCCEFMIEADD